MHKHNNNYEFEYSIPDNDRFLNVDSTRMVMALTNLMHNAISFTPPGGKISLKAELTSKNEMQISVTDSGKLLNYSMQTHMVYKVRSKQKMESFLEDLV